MEARRAPPHVRDPPAGPDRRAFLLHDFPAGNTFARAKNRSDTTRGRTPNMCGIVGYIGAETATPILISGLKRLEYRGYDSAGVTIQENGRLETRKAPGKITELEKVVASQGEPTGHVGIAHTRWATHGVPSERNAHPHISHDGIAIVHNGIIENYHELRRELEAEGHVFNSQTDSEVIQQAEWVRDRFTTGEWLSSRAIVGIDGPGVGLQRARDDREHVVHTACECAAAGPARTAAASGGRR